MKYFALNSNCLKYSLMLPLEEFKRHDLEKNIGIDKKWENPSILEFNLVDNIPQRTEPINQDIFDMSQNIMYNMSSRLIGNMIFASASLINSITKHISLDFTCYSIIIQAGLDPKKKFHDSILTAANEKLFTANPILRDYKILHVHSSTLSLLNFKEITYSVYNYASKESKELLKKGEIENIEKFREFSRSLANEKCKLIPDYFILKNKLKVIPWGGTLLVDNDIKTELESMQFVGLNFSEFTEHKIVMPDLI
jgi:hypothetical protein